jgi:type II secretion system protein N
MSKTESFLTAPLPRPALYFGVPTAFVVLTTFFIILGFPYDALVKNLSIRAENSMEMQLDVGDVDFQLGLLGPAFNFESVRLEAKGGPEIVLDELYIRPAWSFSWLRLAPAFYLDVETPIGSAQGVATLGAARAWKGEFTEIDLESIPFLQSSSTGIELAGVLDAVGDLVFEDGALSGTLEFNARDGDLSHTAVPMGMPYKELKGDLEFGGDDLVVINQVEVLSPMLEARIDGRVGQAESIQDAELDINLSFSKVDPTTVLPLLQGAGAKVSADGTATMHVGGLFSAPDIR